MVSGVFFTISGQLSAVRVSVLGQSQSQCPRSESESYK